MRVNFPSVALILCMGFIFLLIARTMLSGLHDLNDNASSPAQASFRAGLDGNTAGHYLRVPIVNRAHQSDGAQVLTVTLSQGIETDVVMLDAKVVADDTRFICVGVFGDPTRTTTRVGYADRIHCPLPVSKTMPLSGKNKIITDGATKTKRISPSLGQSGSSGGALGSSSMTFGNK